MDSVIDEEIVEPGHPLTLFDSSSDLYLFDDLELGLPELEIGAVTGNEYDLDDIELDPGLEMRSATENEYDLNDIELGPLFAKEIDTENYTLCSLTDVEWTIEDEKVDIPPEETCGELQSQDELEEISENRQFKCGSCEYKSWYKNHVDEHMRQMHVTKSRAKKKKKKGRCDTDALSLLINEESREKNGDSLGSNSTIEIIMDENSANGYSIISESDDKDVGEVCASYVIGQTNDEPFRCIICGKTYLQKRSLNRHIKIHFNGKPEQVPSTSANASVKSSLQISVGEVIRTDYKCATCGEMFIEKNQLRKHVKIHSAKTYPCNVCDYIGTHRNNLILHKKIHTGAKPFRCKFCDYKSVQKSNLRSHMKTHSGEKPYQCDVCDYKCLWKTSLDLHIQKHTGEKPLQCEFCDFKCSHRSRLVSHRKIHTGEKTFCCEFCDYKSGQKSNLRSHMKTHTGVKPYHCDVCDYKSSWKKSLESHIQTHTGEKTFKCEICNFKCSHRSTLRNHINRHGLKTG